MSSALDQGARAGAGGMAPDLAVRIGPLALATPVLLASGTCGYGFELSGLVDFTRIGGIVTKTVTRKPREGNPPPRIAETPSGMLNSIGLENVGIEVFLAEKLPRARTLATRIVVSIGGHSVADYVELASRLADAPGAAAIELNLSCPNVSGGLDLSQNAAGCAQVVGEVRRVTRLPLLAKLTPNVTRVGEIAAAAADAGADAVSLVNTFIGMAIDIERRTPRLQTVTGGLSGPAIRPLALAKVYEAARAVSIPVIGMGGIATAGDAIEFLLAGATAVEVGTANYVEPGGGATIAEGIAAYLVRHELRSPADISGKLRLPESG
jgi:dihydroorotate dehydrogenase (NAD+) catalytic subunit